MRYISYWGGKNYIAFVGDSRIRQLYYEFISLLSNEVIAAQKKHEDLSFTDPKSSLQVVSTYLKGTLIPFQRRKYMINK